MPYIATDIAGALAAPSLARRWRARAVVIAGLGVVVAGVLLSAAAGAVASLPLLIAAVSVIGLGHGAALALVSDLIISNAPEEQTGSAAASQEVAGELGTALGIAAGGTVGVLTYRISIDSLLPPDTDASTAEAARSSLHEAFAAASRLADDGALLAAVREAAANGLTVYAVLAAALTAGTALTVAVGLRRARSE